MNSLCQKMQTDTFSKSPTLHETLWSEHEPRSLKRPEEERKGSESSVTPRAKYKVMFVCVLLHASVCVCLEGESVLSRLGKVNIHEQIVLTHKQTVTNSQPSKS